MRRRFFDKARIIGVPMHLGQPIRGVDKGPALIRQAGLVQRLGGMGWDVTDHGDLEIAVPKHSDRTMSPIHGIAKKSVAIGDNLRRLAALTRETSTNAFSLVLGGDHTIALGSIAGILSNRPDTGVVWVDAHADINTPQTTPSGNMHGMPLSFLMEGLVDPVNVPGFEWLRDFKAVLPANQLVYIGIRDLDPGEVRIIQKLGILAFTMHDIDRFGIGVVMEMVQQHFAGRPLHLSYDIDAVDPIVAPSTGTRVPGGLTFREAHFVAESLALTGRLTSMDLVEVNPDINQDGAEATSHMALEVALSAMGDFFIGLPPRTTSRNTRE